MIILFPFHLDISLLAKFQRRYKNLAKNKACPVEDVPVKIVKNNKNIFSLLHSVILITHCLVCLSERIA